MVLIAYFISASLSFADTVDYNNCNVINRKIIDLKRLQNSTYVDLRCNRLNSLKGLPLKSVKHLDISYNPIESLEDAELDSLIYIDITGTSIYELPEVLCKSKNLLTIVSRNGVLRYVPNCLYKENLRVLNVSLTESVITSQVTNCIALENLTIFGSSKTISIQTLNYISRLPKLSHLGLYDVKSLEGLKNIRDNIKSLSISISYSNDIDGILEELSHFTNLRVLEISIPPNSKIDSKILLLSQVESLMIHYSGKRELVRLPDEVKQLKNLKTLYDFENIKELKLDKGISIISRNFNRDPFLKRNGYTVLTYFDPAMIKLD